MFREKEICDAIRTAYLHLFPDKKERKRALSRLDLELVAQGIRYRGESVLAYQTSGSHVPSTDSIPFREKAAARPPERKGRDAMSVEEMQSYRDLVLENIEYDHLCREFSTYREDLDEIVELIVETVCARRKTTRIAGADFPHEVVRSRFLKLDSSHIEFVMECLHNNTTEIRNMKQYLLTVLFNAPTTMNNHYTAQVNHDMHAGGW